MRRRDFISAAGLWPFAAAAQPDAPVQGSVIRSLREQAETAAAKISQFISEIERQIGLTTTTPWAAAPIAQRRFDYGRLLRQVPAITEFVQLDPGGKELLRVSRRSTDVIGGNGDFSQDPKFTRAVAEKVYYSAVYFDREFEPYMTLALADDDPDAGVRVAEVSLKPISDITARIQVGEHSVAYVLDAQNRVIIHHDVGLIQRDFSSLAQVHAAHAASPGGIAEAVQIALDVGGREVLATCAMVTPLGWLVCVELPTEEANAPAQ